MEEHFLLYLKRGKGGNIDEPTFSTTTNDQKTIFKSLEENKEMNSNQNGFVNNNICQNNLISFCDKAADLMGRE